MKINKVIHISLGVVYFGIILIVACVSSNKYINGELGLSPLISELYKNPQPNFFADVVASIIFCVATPFIILGYIIGVLLAIVLNEKLLWWLYKQLAFIPVIVASWVLIQVLLDNYKNIPKTKKEFIKKVKRKIKC